jgi:hypothetical protein
MTKAKTYIAAAPGTEVIYVEAYYNDDRDDDDPEYRVFVTRFPVALWQVGRDEFDQRVAKPILAEGLLTPPEDMHGVIRCYPKADGTLLCWHSREITTLDEAKAAAIKGAKIDSEEEEERFKEVRRARTQPPPSPEEMVAHQPDCLYVTSNGVGPCTCGEVAALKEAGPPES